MILQIHIENFKSLVNFSVPMSKFTCLIGLNGAGKSTLLQAMDFLAHVITGEVDAWLHTREWSSRDLTSRPLPSRRIMFVVKLYFQSLGVVSWGGNYNTTLNRCIGERVIAEQEEQGNGIVLSVRGEGYRTMTEEGMVSKEISFDYQGSILSRLKTNNPYIAQLKQFFINLKSLELLAPHLMRRRAQTAQDIGLGGEKLSAFLYGLPKESRAHIVEALQTLYPNLIDLQTTNQKFGWKKLSVLESVKSQGLMPRMMSTEARHINDGLLRQLAIVAQTYSKHAFLLFDEIENGMNQEIIGKLIEILLHAPQQIVITTHSPQILNFLPDDVAKESVLFLYKTPRGSTRARRFFDLPVTSKKLEILGPGEVYADTNLEALVQDALHLDNMDPTP